MNTGSGLNRRDFIVSTLGAGGALVIGTAASASAATIGVKPWGDATPAGEKEFTPWLSIAPNGKVTVRVTHPDIGNGLVTQALSYVREELEPRWEDLHAEYAPVDRNLREGGVYAKNGPLSYFSGRSTSPGHMNNFMTVAATAREQLKAAAAKSWNVPAGEITVKEGVLSHKSGKSAPYGQMVAAASAIRLPEPVKPKPREQWTFLGKASPAKVQIPHIVNGSAVYGMDVQVPGKVYAALRQSPAMGGSVVSVNADAVKKMPGVLAVVEIKASELGEKSPVKTPFPLGAARRQAAVAVIAEHYWQAKIALDALEVRWDDGPGVKWKTTEMMNEAALAAVDKPAEGDPLTSKGDAAAEFAKGGTIVEAKYMTPYCDHMVMEPLNGVAMVTPDGVELWQPTQHTEMAFSVAAAEAEVPLEKVKAHQTFVGCGFGRRIMSDDVRMVVAVAKAFPGRPVHTIWSREETTRQGRYRPLVAAYMKARLGDDGYPTAMQARIAGGPGFYASIQADAVFQIVPNVDVESTVIRDFHLMTGPYRGPGFNSNIFFVESFVDELARAAKADPMDYRIGLYTKWADEGWVKVLRELKEKSGWGAPLPARQGRGVAIGNWAGGGKPQAGSTCAAVAHVEVTGQGQIKVHRVDVAFDFGRILNRDAVLVQLEGGTIFGLNMAMNEELNVRNGRVIEGNYDEYPLLRTSDAPEIHVHFGGQSDHARYSEVGEPPVGPVGPAVANAVFQAVGVRMRTQPFRKHNLAARSGTA